MEPKETSFVLDMNCKCFECKMQKKKKTSLYATYFLPKLIRTKNVLLNFKNNKSIQGYPISTNNDLFIENSSRFCTVIKLAIYFPSVIITVQLVRIYVFDSTRGYCIKKLYCKKIGYEIFLIKMNLCSY